jgi:hypothetical protein
LRRSITVVATRDSNRSRRETVAALRRDQERARRHKRLAVVSVVAVVVVIVALVAVKLAQGSSSAPAAASGTASSSVVAKVTSIPQSTYDAVGVGTVAAALSPIRPAQPITAGGKPRVLYVGAEYCPYCAAERWAVVAALSRFGTFRGLGETRSSSSDVFPSTATLSFHGASYSSRYLAFSGYETQSNQRQGNSYAPLDTLPSSDEAIFSKINAPPYVPAAAAGGIPFVDLGGHSFISGATYDPGVLKGLSHQQIADRVADPSTDVAKNIDGSANMITAALCRLTGDKPGGVCSSAGVRAAAGKVPSS